MEEKSNVAEILKDKPQGTKLYSILSDGECFLNEASEDSIYIDIDNRKRFWCFTVYGSTHSFPNGCVLLFPSREMRDWSKFAWKKGDLLVNSCGFQCIFKEWSSDDYTKFNGCYSNSRDGYEDVSNAETAKFDKLDNNIAYGYVREIERKLGGILNLETLKIEKAQPEFKDGDIVVTDAVPSLCYSKCILILKGDLNTNENSANSYVFYNINNNRISFDVLDTAIRCRNIRLATEEEKKQLFSALEKKGKVWDSEHKMIVDLPKKCEFKPFDKVVVRDTEYSTWCADLFSHIDEDYRYACVGATWSFCIPYNEETAHLLGTTEDWEGGEQ
nr:MAG TPA: hypothetical protein [Caudoviricetes sp.]